MFVVYVIVTFIYLRGQCEAIVIPPLEKYNDEKLTDCIAGIVFKYFAENKAITYVNFYNTDDDLILKTIHSTMNLTLISRKPLKQMFFPNLGYVVSSASVSDFNEYFEYLIREPAWNPYARFLIIISFIHHSELTVIFNVLLKVHVNNVLVVNATNNGELYTYNPFDNYACGKNYNAVINYGMCSRTAINLYPNKLVTGLRKCNFIASIAHRPPFNIDPEKVEEEKSLLGVEEYIITELGKIENFTITFNYSYNANLFSSVAPNMTAIGPMLMLQNNECDVIFGGMMMVTTRARAFTYLCGYHDYGEILGFTVKTSSFVPTWKYIYLEFELGVWVLLLLTFLLFSAIIIYLLHSKDICEVILRLLDNLLLHGRDVRTRHTIKYLLIAWIWFSYLINSFYQSSLYSFTTQPIKDYQVSNEYDLEEYNYKPCFSLALREFLSTESSKMSLYKNLRNDGCQTTPEALNTISKTNNLFSIIPQYIYLYNERKLIDKWGNPLIYYFDKPYTKFLFGYFFYKGFPITQTLQLNALRMRESGLTSKILRDHYYSRKLKQRLSQRTFESSFPFPWCICIPGVVMATIVFIIELLKTHTKIFTCSPNLRYY